MRKIFMPEELLCEEGFQENLNLVSKVRLGGSKDVRRMLYTYILFIITITITTLHYLLYFVIKIFK